MGLSNTLQGGSKEEGLKKGAMTTWLELIPEDRAGRGDEKYNII
jgi:hypothetical protein